MTRRPLGTTLRAAVLAGCVALLPGCAAWVVVDMAASLAAAQKIQPRAPEPIRREFAQPAADVFAVLVQQVEHNGRKIIERDDATQTLRVSYPFSWLKNNWGGTLQVRCETSEFGSTLTLLGDGRDVAPHVRDIADEVIDDVDQALRRLPRTL